MIDLKNVEKSVKYFSVDAGRTYEEEISNREILFELAKAVLAVSKEMPYKIVITEEMKFNNRDRFYAGRHDAIDECTLVTMRLLAEKDELIERLERDIACLRSAWQDTREELERLKEENRVLKIRLSNFTDKENNV